MDFLFASQQIFLAVVSDIFLGINRTPNFPLLDEHLNSTDWHFQTFGYLFMSFSLSVKLKLFSFTELLTVLLFSPWFINSAALDELHKGFSRTKKHNDYYT